MCGRIFVKTSLEKPISNFPFAVRGGDIDGLGNRFPRWNGAPSLDYPIIVRDVVREPDITGPIFVSARWGLLPSWANQAAGRRRSMSAARASLPTACFARHIVRAGA